MRLVPPDVRYKESFLEALQEYQQEPTSERHDIYALEEKVLRKDFQSYVTKLREEAAGNGLPDGYVPQTTYWLIDNNEYIGRTSIRHLLTEFLLQLGGHIGYDIRPSKRHQGYGKKILKLALPKAKALGITRVLVTCDETNLPSKKIIEANGGVYENSLEQGQDLPRKLRYWIAV